MGKRLYRTSFLLYSSTLFEEVGQVFILFSLYLFPPIAQTTITSLIAESLCAWLPISSSLSLEDYATWNSVKLSFGSFRKTPRASCLVPRVVAGALKIARQRLFILKLNGCPTAEQSDTFTQVESSRAYCIRQQEISPWLHLSPCGLLPSSVATLSFRRVSFHSRFTFGS